MRSDQYAGWDLTPIAVSSTADSDRRAARGPGRAPAKTAPATTSAEVAITTGSDGATPNRKLFSARPVPRREHAEADTGDRHDHRVAQRQPGDVAALGAGANRKPNSRQRRVTLVCASPQTPTATISSDQRRRRSSSSDHPALFDRLQREIFRARRYVPEIAGRPPGQSASPVRTPPRAASHAALPRRGGRHLHRSADTFAPSARGRMRRHGCPRRRLTTSWRSPFDRRRASSADGVLALQKYSANGSLMTTSRRGAAPVKARPAMRRMPSVSK